MNKTDELMKLYHKALKIINNQNQHEKYKYFYAWLNNNPQLDFEKNLVDSDDTDYLNMIDYNIFSLDKAIKTQEVGIIMAVLVDVLVSVHEKKGGCEQLM